MPKVIPKSKNKLPTTIPNAITLPTPTPLFDDFDSVPADHDKVDAQLSNLALAGIYALWEQPIQTANQLITTIKQTMALVKQRRALYSLHYGNPDSDKSSNPTRHRAFPID